MNDMSRGKNEWHGETNKNEGKYKGTAMKCKQAFRAKHQQQQNLAKKSKFHEKMGNANDEEKSWGLRKTVIYTTLASKSYSSSRKLCRGKNGYGYGNGNGCGIV